MDWNFTSDIVLFLKWSNKCNKNKIKSYKKCKEIQKYWIIIALIFEFCISKSENNHPFAKYITYTSNSTPLTARRVRHLHLGVQMPCYYKRMCLSIIREDDLPLGEKVRYIFLNKKDLGNFILLTFTALEVLEVVFLALLLL